MESITLGTINTVLISNFCSWVLCKDNIMVEAASRHECGSGKRALVHIKVLFNKELLFEFRIYKDHSSFKSFADAVENNDIEKTVSACLQNLPLKSFVSLIENLINYGSEAGKDELRNDLYKLITPKKITYLDKEMVRKL